MTIDLSKLAFLSTVNYMKRSPPNTGSTPLALPGSGLTTSYSVTHNFGYIPYFDVFVDIDNDGVIWAGEKVDRYTDSSNTGVSPAAPSVDYWSTTTVLTISINNSTSPVATGSRTIYWVTYLDYGNL